MTNLNNLKEIEGFGEFFKKVVYLEYCFLVEQNSEIQNGENH